MVELNEKLSFAALEPLTGFQTASSGAKQNFNSPAAPSGTLLEVSGLEGIVSRQSRSNRRSRIGRLPGLISKKCALLITRAVDDVQNRYDSVLLAVIHQVIPSHEASGSRSVFVALPADLRGVSQLSDAGFDLIDNPDGDLKAGAFRPIDEDRIQFAFGRS
jgi:hypothetical protein